MQKAEPKMEKGSQYIHLQRHHIDDQFAYEKMSVISYQQTSKSKQ